MQVTLNRSEKASLFLKRFFGAIYWSIPGSIMTIKGKRETYTVMRSLWVKISDGNSSDLMPLTLCSQSFVDTVTAELEKHWFLRRIKLTPRQHEYVESRKAKLA